MENKKDNQPITVETEKLPEPTSLLQGMHTIVSHASNSELTPSYFEDVKVPLDYLCRRLNLTPIQVTLLAVIMEIYCQSYADIGRIAEFLNTSSLVVMSYSSDLDTLEARRLVLTRTRGDETCYIVPKEVYNAFSHDESYTYQPPVIGDDEALADHIDRMLCDLNDRDHDKDLNLFDKEIHELIFANSQVRLSRTFLSIYKKCSAAEFRVALLMGLLWIRDSEKEIDGQQFGVVFCRQFEVQQMVNSLNSGKSQLVKNKIVAAASSDGVMQKNVFSLTPQVRKALTPDRNLDSNADTTADSRLRRHTDIVAKDLVYNPETATQIDQLHTLFQPEQMDAILQRLKERGMRGGFTCLLYGGPGTGKTETVLQMARRCGRDLFQVDVSQLRSKWYGESERLVKGVFNNYRKLVRQSKVAPIMFFNEADAIFNRRMENAERTVDKSENAIQNIILQEMETLDGILIATTNLQGNLDSAFERRFLYKVLIDKPRPMFQAEIWRNMIPELSPEAAHLLADRFDFSGGQIENIARKSLVDELTTGKKPGYIELVELCQNELLVDNHHRPIGFK